MTAFVSLLAGAGVVLMLSGVPPMRRLGLADRVEPYLPRGRFRSRPRLLQRVARAAPVRDDLGRRLVAAGEERTPDQFRVEQTLWALGGLVGAITIALAAASAGVVLDTTAIPAFTMLAAVTGWTARDWTLTRRVERRRAALAEELPAAIDLLVLALLAGESVPAACARISGLLRGPLRAEMEAVLADVRAGTPVVESFEAFARRVDEPAVDRFVEALCTGIEKGAPLADVLRAQADDGRELRRRRLLEMGGRREVWMLVPVVFLVMPVVVVWALYPGLVSLDLLVP